MRPMEVGDRVRDRNAGSGRTGLASTGVVVSLTLPNPPWHDGGKPCVQPDDGGPVAYWHYAELDSEKAGGR